MGRKKKLKEFAEQTANHNKSKEIDTEDELNEAGKNKTQDCLYPPIKFELKPMHKENSSANLKSKCPKFALKCDNDVQEALKDITFDCNFKDPWLAKGIVVNVISKDFEKLGFFRKKRNCDKN